MDSLKFTHSAWMERRPSRRRQLQLSPTELCCRTASDRVSGRERPGQTLCAERGSRETVELSERAEVVATSLVSRAEVAAALAKAVRIGLFGAENARKARQAFVAEWTDIARIPVT